jgi:hypothetical protein
MDYQRRIGPGRPLSSPTRPERGGPLDVLVEPRTAPLTTAQPGFRLTSARSSVPGEEPAGNSHAGPDLACEVLLAQPNLAALAPRELGGRHSPAWARPVPGPGPAGVWLSADGLDWPGSSTRGEAG